MERFSPSQRQRRDQKRLQTLKFKSCVPSAQMTAHLAVCSRVWDYVIPLLQFVPSEVVWMKELPENAVLHVRSLIQVLELAECFTQIASCDLLE